MTWKPYPKLSRFQSGALEAYSRLKGLSNLPIVLVFDPATGWHGYVGHDDGQPNDPTQNYGYLLTRIGEVRIIAENVDPPGFRYVEEM